MTKALTEFSWNYNSFAITNLHNCPHIFGMSFQLTVTLFETCLKSFLFIQRREIYFIHGRVYKQFIRSGLYRARCKSRENAGEKAPVHAALPQNTNYPLQFDKPHEAATEWNNSRKSKTVVPLLAVSLKNIPLCLSALCDIYPDPLADRSRKFSTYKRTQHVRACRRFNRSPLDEPAVHIKQESQSPEGGKHTRLIKRELPDGSMEQETEEDQADEREYSESHGHDSGQDEDIAEDLSMAPDIMIPEDQVEA